MTQALLPPPTIEKLPQPWLSSARWDSALIIAPAFVTSVIALALGSSLNAHGSTMPLWAWVCLVLLVDVAHVYATLFRTYFDPQAFRNNSTLLLAIPFACWAVGCLLHSIDGLLFWKALAYLAVFHFIRQQYGFMALYSRKEPDAFRKFRMLDSTCLYLAAFYPILYWHTHLPRNFVWFVEGDFFQSVPSFISAVGLIAYVMVAVSYMIKELWLLKSTGYVNIPKNLIIFGTALSWWVGIISLNSDLAFTMTNVLSHGIPYMALIWLYERNFSNMVDAAGGSMASFRKLLLASLPAFIFFLWILAYLEEGFWDGFIWREHGGLFHIFSRLPEISDPVVLALLVPLLALPQSTHYVLDGFIWRVKDRSSSWSI